MLQPSQCVSLQLRCDFVHACQLPLDITVLHVQRVDLFHTEVKDFQDMGGLVRNWRVLKGGKGVWVPREP